MARKSSIQHIKEMSERYGNEIRSSIRNTMVRENTTEPEGEGKIPEILLEETDSVSAVFMYAADDTAVLNFANYTEPGGGYLYYGAVAQEEALCSESTLYNVLSGRMEYYKANRRDENSDLYYDRGLFSPGIIFERDSETVECAVITVAAPNRDFARLRGISEERNATALKERIRFILNMAEREGVKTLILGAFGCGAFSQDPHAVSEEFMTLLRSGKYGFEKVVFAIPNQRSENYRVFRDAIYKNK